MSTPITRLEAYVNNNGIGEYPSLVTDIASVIAQCRILQEQVKSTRELTLNEVAAYLRAESNRYLGADEHHERAEAFHVAAEEVAAGQFRAASADPELARLEREVARAAVAFAHVDVAYRSAPFAEGSAWAYAWIARDEAVAALRDFLAAKRKGDAK